MPTYALLRSAQINPSLDFIFIYTSIWHLAFCQYQQSHLSLNTLQSQSFYCKQSMQLCCHYYSEGVSQEQHYIQHFKKTDLYTTANPALVLNLTSAGFVGLVLLGLVPLQYTEAMGLGLCWLLCLILILINVQLYS